MELVAELRQIQAKLDEAEDIVDRLIEIVKHIIDEEDIKD